MRALGHGWRRLWPISGEPVVGSAGKGSGSSPGSPRARFTPALEIGVASTVPGEGTAAARPAATATPACLAATLSSWDLERVC
jgi:hypothetical protein